MPKPLAPRRRLTPSFQVTDAAIHNEGAIGSKPAKVMAVYIVEKGKLLVQPAQ